jgi:hypothetical protein
MKKVLIVILAGFIVAAFFYAAIWTNEKNTLSECFLFTGFVAIGQIMLTCVFYPLTLIRD